MKRHHRHKLKDWDKLVDELFELDKQNPYLGQMIERSVPPIQKIVKKTVKQQFSK